ncbi:MAG: diguanylate cyclase [Phycisphaerae bacterium]
MKRISTTTSIAIGFACIITSAVLAAQMFGLVPDRAATIADEHLRLAQVVAAQCSVAADKNDAAAIRTALSVLMANNSDVLSAGVRSPDGKLVITAGPHERLWRAGPRDASSNHPLKIQVPVFQHKEKWATIEICFAALPDTNLFGNSLLRLTLFLAASGFTGSLFFLRKALKHLDPSSVIPDRVRAMLDALAEGVIIMDRSEQIVMANQAFSDITGLTLPQIQGRRIHDLKNLMGDSLESTDWIAALRSGEQVRRMTVHLAPKDREKRSLVFNAVPVLGQDGSKRGILATFDDVTSIESANAELAKSRDEIARQNKELEALASHDPLTGCLNRRAFMRLFEQAWAAADAAHPIACLMLDVDHFKQVNDRHGHSAGDEVLKQMGQLLQRQLRTGDRVCRYGGEEFCIFLADTSFEEAHQAASRLRETILAATWPVSNITASIGVAGREAGATEVHQLLDQADKALYAAKRAGRNRVVAWGDPAIESGHAITSERRDAHPPATLQVVTDALSAMLQHCDADTCNHSRRVAELAARFAKPLLADQDLEILRLAALLHDLGKLAIPDAVLRKPGPLTEEEWKIMREHESTGTQIVEQATHHPALAEIVRCHHAWYAGTPRDPELPAREQIPVAARILSIIDAFDAMVSDRVYRKGMDMEKACAELLRCAGTQFDPELVEQFVGWIRTKEATIADRVNALATQAATDAANSIQQQVHGIALAASTHLAPARNPLSKAQNQHS